MKRKDFLEIFAILHVTSNENNILTFVIINMYP